MNQNKQHKLKNEVQVIETATPPETFQLGEIGISSSVIPADKLSKIVLQMLEKESVKEYLDLCKGKRMLGHGVG